MLFVPNNPDWRIEENNHGDSSFRAEGNVTVHLYLHYILIQAAKNLLGLAKENICLLGFLQRTGWISTAAAINWSCAIACKMNQLESVLCPHVAWPSQVEQRTTCSLLEMLPLITVTITKWFRCGSHVWGIMPCFLNLK